MFYIVIALFCYEQRTRDYCSFKRYYIGYKISSFACNIGNHVVPGKGRTSEDQMEALEGLLGLVLIVADKASRLRLSKEGRAKADKNRQKVEETFLKNTHVQRQASTE